MSSTIETAVAPSGHAHAAHHWHEDPETHLAHHFDTPQQQFDSGKLGIWLFLVTEILFFSGLFCAYTIYRHFHPEVFVYASKFLDTNMGFINTLVLIFSSLTAAWAVRNAQLNQKKSLVINIVLTIACAFAFMGIKYVEYSHKIHDGLLPGPAYTRGLEPPAAAAAGHAAAVDPTAGMDRPDNVHIFFGIYFFMTGLHGFHVLAGIVVWLWLLKRAIKGEFNTKYFGPIDYAALYWHIVDLIWIYLFPLLYLIH
ncbi:MAG: cytochrome c oxidase subunit 3 family protein [Planctomycetes bacterium]|nr:cytochrome c oxidase subunit 3 family protein [Planctomycetota bacterium]MCC7171732.1 cytochrome c oxidase subunit 3 family protein [Planctomycetota bacterium]